MSEYTAQEWQRTGTTVYALNIEGTNRFSAQVQGGWATDGRLRTEAAELEANARLMEAAKDLLEANVKMVDMLNVAFHIESDSDDEVIYDQLPTSGVASVYFLARAAIRKATGAQT